MQVKFFFLSLLFVTLRSHSQEISSAEDSLRFYGDAMFSLKIPPHRLFAETRFLDLSSRLIRSNADSNLLKFHPSFVTTESHDHSVKIVSWQIEQETKEYHYCAYIFLKNSNPIFLKSINRNLGRINYEVFNQNNWYGAMYYNFLEEQINGYYTIFGYRFSNDGYKYRIVELIKFEDGKVVFGAPIFKTIGPNGDEDLLYRKIISYSASANVALKYDAESKMILFDHIQRFTDPQSGEMLRAPDGTFEAFELKNNMWNYIPYHKLQILDTPPREKPVLDSRNKDLFGRDRKD